jgi:perosamine synthetase
MEKIPVSGPWITQKEIDYVADAAKKSWNSNANMYNVRFEMVFAEYLGVKYAICLPSCTSELHLSLLELGVCERDEAIVPDITSIATGAPISYVDATPVFADINPKTWSLSAGSFAACITPRTKAVIPVDLYGNVAILTIARKHDIAVIENAAEVIGSEYRGERLKVLISPGLSAFTVPRL